MLVELALIHRRGFYVFAEPFLELLVVVEKLRHDEVKQGPQFCHRVLDRCARQKKSVACVEAKKDLPTATCIVLDCLSLVKNHVVPLDLHQLGLVFHVVDDEIVGRQKHMDLHLWVV